MSRRLDPTLIARRGLKRPIVDAALIGAVDAMRTHRAMRLLGLVAA